MEVLHNSQKFQEGTYAIVVPVPRVLLHGSTELTKVSGTGMNVAQSSQKFWVRVWKSYRTYGSSEKRAYLGRPQSQMVTFGNSC